MVTGLQHSHHYPFLQDRDGWWACVLTVSHSVAYPCAKVGHFHDQLCNASAALTLAQGLSHAVFESLFLFACSKSPCDSPSGPIPQLASNPWRHHLCTSAPLLTKGKRPKTFHKAHNLDWISGVSLNCQIVGSYQTSGLCSAARLCCSFVPIKSALRNFTLKSFASQSSHRKNPKSEIRLKSHIALLQGHFVDTLRVGGVPKFVFPIVLHWMLTRMVRTTEMAEWLIGNTSLGSEVRFHIRCKIMRVPRERNPRRIRPLSGDYADLGHCSSKGPIS